MNDLSMDDASTDILLLGDDELDQVSGGVFPILIGIIGMSFFAGAFFGTLTSQLIRHLR